MENNRGIERCLLKLGKRFTEKVGIELDNILSIEYGLFVRVSKGREVVKNRLY